MARLWFLQLLAVCFALLFSSTVALSLDKVHDKRASALDTLWRATREKLGGNQAKEIRYSPAVAKTWALTYLYGCTGIMITDPRFIVMGHLLHVGVVMLSWSTGDSGISPHTNIAAFLTAKQRRLYQHE
jgi:hypothetical protein